MEFDGGEDAVRRALGHVDFVADGIFAFLLGFDQRGGGVHVGGDRVGALGDHRRGGLRLLHRVGPGVHVGDMHDRARIGGRGAEREGVHIPQHVGDREAFQHAERLGLGGVANGHAGEVPAFTGLGVEALEVRRSGGTGDDHIIAVADGTDRPPAPPGRLLSGTFST
jgi:hypothetical protein